MNKKKKTLWILIGCFLLLVVLLVGIQTWGKKKEEKDAEKAEAEKTYLFQTIRIVWIIRVSQIVPIIRVTRIVPIIPMLRII